MKKTFLIFYLVLALFFTKDIVFASSSIKDSKTTYQVPVLVYHSFGPALSKKESKLAMHYRVTEKMFEEQMKYLYTNGYHPISFSNYVNSFKDGSTLPEKAVVLTFDDGWKTQYKYAIPILEKYKFTATFFIVTDYVDNKYPAYMSWDNLKDLVAHGFDIESHTKTHQMLTKANSKKLLQELVDSKKTLEEKLKIKVTTLAYPDYMHNKTVRSAVESAGYLGARGGWGNFKNSIDHIYELRSEEVVNNPNPFSSKRLSDLP